MKWCSCGLSIWLAVQQPTIAPPTSNAAGQDVLQSNTLCNAFNTIGKATAHYSITQYQCSRSSCSAGEHSVPWFHSMAKRCTAATQLFASQHKTAGPCAQVNALSSRPYRATRQAALKRQDMPSTYLAHHLWKVSLYLFFLFLMKKEAQLE